MPRHVATGGIAAPRSVSTIRSRYNPTVIEALAAYARIRDRHLPHPSNRTFFVSTTGTPVIYGAFGSSLRKLLLASGVGADSAQVHPRIHDLRHSFAVHTLVRWYRDGKDVAALLPRLSTYLGHRAPGLDLLVPVGRPGTARAGRQPARKR